MGLCVHHTRDLSRVALSLTRAFITTELLKAKALLMLMLKEIIHHGVLFQLTSNVL